MNDLRLVKWCGWGDCRERHVWREDGGPVRTVEDEAHPTAVLCEGRPAA